MIELQIIIVDLPEGGGFLIFGDAAFEEVLLLFDVHHLREPWEGIGDTFVEGREAAGNQTAVGDEVDVFLEVGRVQTDRSDRKTVADEFLLKPDALGHGVAQVFPERVGPDVRIFIDEIHQQVAENLDVVRFIAQRVTEHLADAGKFVLAVETEDHAEQAIELRAFHDLAKQEDILGERLLVFGFG